MNATTTSTTNTINLIMSKDEFERRLNNVHTNNNTCRAYSTCDSYYRIYLYLINSNGTRLEYPKPNHQYGDYAKLLDGIKNR